MDEINETPQENEEKPEIEISIPENVFLIVEGTKAIPLDKPIIKIGRAHDNTVVLDDPRVSRHHVEIRLIRDHFVLFDLKSSGGTYINGKRIDQGLLYRGDLISLAGVNLVFMQDTLLPGRGGMDASGKFHGLGERATAIFQSSLFNKKKKGGSGFK
jgi:pSer/pThr/pTyr-binding forkhead associated (FHA) protein